MNSRFSALANQLLPTWPQCAMWVRLVLTCGSPFLVATLLLHAVGKWQPWMVQGAKEQAITWFACVLVVSVPVIVGMVVALHAACRVKCFPSAQTIHQGYQDHDAWVARVRLALSVERQAQELAAHTPAAPARKNINRL